MRNILLLIVISGCFLQGCGSYSKMMRSDDLKMKEEKAIEYYNNRDYSKALPIFEELITYYKGTKKGEDLMYYYCYCYFGNDEYLLAAYNFKLFATSYPTNPHAEECLYMSAKSYYYTSPRPSLDQTSTTKAINELQIYINQFPQSKYVDEANQMIDQMRRKLEEKDYMSCQLYYNMENYKAAASAFTNLAIKYTDSPNADKISFMALKSNYLLAINSIEDKKRDRLAQTINVYNTFAERFPSSKYFKDAQDINENCKKLLIKTQKHE